MRFREAVDTVEARYAYRFGYCGTAYEAAYGLWYALLPHQEEVHVIEITKADTGIWAALKQDALLEEGESMATRFQSMVENVGITKAIEAVLADPTVHFFTQDTIRRGLQMDPVDAFHDVELASEVLRAFLDHVLPTKAKA